MTAKKRPREKDQGDVQKEFPKHAWRLRRRREFAGRGFVVSEMTLKEKRGAGEGCLKQEPEKNLDRAGKKRAAHAN